MYDHTKSIKVVGSIVSILSALIIIGNASGVVVFSSINEPAKNIADIETEIQGIAWIIHHYIEFCLVMGIVGLLYLIGGMYMRKYKMWANYLVTTISSLLIIVIWLLVSLASISTPDIYEIDFLSLSVITVALFWSAPLAVLIWYLNRKKVRKYFL